MAVIERLQFSPCDDPGEPDDFRPRSKWAAAVDPASPDRAFVRDLSLFVDVVAPGDRVPLHRHPIDELMIVEEEMGQVTLGDGTHVVSSGAVIFVPAGLPHGAYNIGSEQLVVEGRTNKDVAAALFVTVRTVESNLTRVYSKLGVRSRTELAAHGLPSEDESSG